MSIVIHDEVEQGTPEWLALRCGRFTASEADKLVTAKTLKPSAQADKLLARKLGEWATGGVLDDDWGGSWWTERGHAVEPSAREFFAVSTGLEVRTVAFVERGWLGASPDGLVYDGDIIVSGVELKCPGPERHVRTWMVEGLPDEYRLQVQWSMWVLGVDHWWWMSYCPGLPPVLHRVERDQDVYDAFDAVVPPLLDRYETLRERLRQDGVTPPEPGVVPDPEAPPGLEGAYQ